MRMVLMKVNESLLKSIVTQPWNENYVYARDFDTLPLARNLVLRKTCRPAANQTSTTTTTTSTTTSPTISTTTTTTLSTPIVTPSGNGKYICYTRRLHSDYCNRR